MSKHKEVKEQPVQSDYVSWVSWAHIKLIHTAALVYFLFYLAHEFIKHWNDLMRTGSIVL